jgi:hypothetical protein
MRPTERSYGGGEDVKLLLRRLIAAIPLTDGGDAMVQTPTKSKPQMDRDLDSTADPADQVYIHLSERARDLVLETMEGNASPNDALKDLAQRYNERYG